MKKISKKLRIERLIQYLPKLSEGQVIWLERIAYQFTRDKTFTRNSDSSIILSDKVLYDFGDSLRIHHYFTAELFTKNKFECMLANVMNYYARLGKL